MIQDYALLPNVYTAEECRDLCECFEQVIDRQLKDIPSSDTVKTADVGITTLGAIGYHLDKFKDVALDANKQVFGFDLFQLGNSDTVHYNQYHDHRRGEYSWHIDAVRGAAKDLKLTVLLNASWTPYTGGEFRVFISGEQWINFTPGSMLIIPSWMPHMVTPVTLGTRRSVSLFLSGPVLR